MRENNLSDNEISLKVKTTEDLKDTVQTIHSLITSNEQKDSVTTVLFLCDKMTVIWYDVMVGLLCYGV